MGLSKEKLKELALEEMREAKEQEFWEWMEYQNRVNCAREFIEEHCLEEEFINWCKAEFKRCEE